MAEKVGGPFEALTEYPDRATVSLTPSATEGIAMYTLGTAAKAVGLNKSTISKAIASGRLSARKNDFGRFEIDPAELHRVYPPLPTPEKSEREAMTEITSENRELKARLEVLKQLLDDIQADRDHWRQQATALLPPIIEAKARPPLRSFWSWFWPW